LKSFEYRISTFLVRYSSPLSIFSKILIFNHLITNNQSQITKMPPAARIGDMHVCPMVTGVVPHVGGPIIGPGTPTVLIAGMPAAVLGDMVTCTGPPDSIVMGSTTVMIGGKPAARMGDSTAHGGSIVLGAPTVIIG
jgi:uncharacterized Zn-binding protein involved in type VI secretion